MLVWVRIALPRLLSCPSSLAQVLRHMVPLFFTQDTQGVWQASKPQQDLLVSYILVLVMLACDGRLQADALAELRTVRRDRVCVLHG